MKGTFTVRMTSFACSCLKHITDSSGSVRERDANWDTIHGIFFLDILSFTYSSLRVSSTVN